MLTTRDKHVLIATFFFSFCFLITCALVGPRYMSHLVRAPMVVTTPVVDPPVIAAAKGVAPAIVTPAPIARRKKVVRHEHDTKQPPSIGDCKGDPLCHILD